MEEGWGREIRVSLLIQVCDRKGHGQVSYTNENTF